MSHSTKSPVAFCAILLTSLAVSLAPVFGDTFGAGAFDIDFVEVGNAGNANDTHGSGYGGVNYNYRIAVNEVSESMIASYNSLSGGPVITTSSRGADKPATNVSWNEAARFVNWLNTSSGYSEAYNFTASGFDNITPWTAVDAGYDASNPYRNSEAFYFIPSEDEWYKAAYYDPNSGSYFDYATGSDTAPTAVSGGVLAGTAVYSGQSLPADITDAGGLSPYGTMAQSGNVWEFVESASDGSNDSGIEDRIFRGSNWSNTQQSALRAANREEFDPLSGFSSVGFRVGSVVPEPSSALLMFAGFAGLLLKRKRSCLS